MSPSQTERCPRCKGTGRIPNRRTHAMNRHERDDGSGSVLLLPVDVAKMLGVTTRTLYTWRQEGRGPACVLVNDRARYSRAAVRTFMRERR